MSVEWKNCQHVWRPKVDSQYSNESVEEVVCVECECPGERDTFTGFVVRPTTKKERAEWLKRRSEGMQSAIGEYVPSEFWDLLLDVDTLQRQLAEKQAEIEAMRPVVENAESVAEMHAIADWDGSGNPCLCSVCKEYRDYESRKKP